MATSSSPDSGTDGARVIPTPMEVPSWVRDRVTVVRIKPNWYGLTFDGEDIGSVWPSETRDGFWAFTTEGETCVADGVSRDDAIAELVIFALQEDEGDAAEEPEDGGKGLRDHPGISNGDVAQVRAYGAAHIALVSGFMDRFEDHLSPWALELIRRHMESALDHTERLIAAVQIQLDEEG